MKLNIAARIQEQIQEKLRYHIAEYFFLDTEAVTIAVTSEA
jgi:hypothetical protein